MNNKGSGIQLRTAFKALKRLLANPQATEEVFTIINALSGPALKKGCQRFASSDYGKHVLATRVDLIQTLQNKEHLARLPENTLGSHYLAFVEKEQLTADGLVEASQDEVTYTEMNEDLKRFATRQRDSHDLWHTLTQYGRNELGELCLLAFTYAQTGNRGIGLIVLAGSMKMRKYYGLSVFSTVFRAYRDGKSCQWLPAQNWELLLEKPIEEVRTKLGIQDPVAYQQLLLATPATA